MGSQLVVSLKKQRSLYGNSIRLVSPAKINLYFNILGSYPDGFHRIESIIERVSLFDTLTINLTRTPAIRIRSNMRCLIKNDNLCVKAASLMRGAYKIPFGFSLFLEKKIPIGAGLGGASSNAASTLIGINHLLGLKLNRQQLYKLGKQLGSDVNFFLSQQPLALVEGRGEIVKPLALKRRLTHYIVWPSISLSTKKVYSVFTTKLTKFLNNVNIMRYALAHGDIFLLRKSVFNALEKSAFNTCRQLEIVKKRLDESGNFFAMTGSGSAFFSIAPLSKKEGQKRFRLLQNLLPKKWSIFCVQTF